MATRRRFGTVRKLPSGRFQARYVGPDGLRHQAPGTFATKTDAARWLSAVETDIDRNIWLNPGKSNVRLTTYANEWIAARRVSGRPLAPRTLVTYQHSLDAWITRPIDGVSLGLTPLGGLSAAQVRMWHSKVAERGGRTAARQAYALLRAVLNTAVDENLITRTPCRLQGAGQATSVERPVISDEEMLRLADAMPEHLYAFVILAFHAQLRHGELLALRRSDVDLERGMVRVSAQVVEVKRVPLVVPPKASSARVLHIADQAVSALREHLATRPSLPEARIFVHRDGSELRQHHVHAAWRKARQTAGVPHARVHDLRHAGLTAVAQEGAITKEIMRRAGHSTPRAAMIYQHAVDSRDAEIAASLTRRAARR